MKKLIYIVSVLVLLSACQQNDLLVSPDGNTEQVISQAKEPNWLQLPAPNDLLLSKESSITKTIKHKKGGNIKLKFEYEGGPFDEVHGELEIWFDKKAWDKDLFGEEIDISLSFEDENAVVTFDPHMEFDICPEFWLYLEGLDLSSIDEDEVKFAYLASDGSYEIIDADIKIKKKHGKIIVKKALIPHFSRFGFLN